MVFVELEVGIPNLSIAYVGLLYANCKEVQEIVKNTRMINNNNTSVQKVGKIKYQMFLKTNQMKKIIPLTKNNTKIDM